MSGEAQQAASGGCIAASPRLRVLVQSCANAKTYNVDVRMSARYRLDISQSRTLNHRNSTGISSATEQRLQPTFRAYPPVNGSRHALVCLKD